MNMQMYCKKIWADSLLTLEWEGLSNYDSKSRSHKILINLTKDKKTTMRLKKITIITCTKLKYKLETGKNRSGAQITGKGLISLINNKLLEIEEKKKASRSREK